MAPARRREDGMHPLALHCWMSSRVSRRTITKTTPLPSLEVRGLSAAMHIGIMEPTDAQGTMLTNGDHEDGQKKEMPPTFIPDAEQILSPENNRNGGTMPPQQVYVNTPLEVTDQNGMAGLQSQFMSLGMNGESENGDANGQEDDRAPNGDNDAEEHSEFEGFPLKLFVGQVRFLLSCLERFGGPSMGLLLLAATTSPGCSQAGTYCVTRILTPLHHCMLLVAADSQEFE